MSAITSYGTTSHLWAHLEGKHPSVYEQTNFMNLDPEQNNIIGFYFQAILCVISIMLIDLACVSINLKLYKSFIKSYVYQC